MISASVSRHPVSKHLLKRHILRLYSTSIEPVSKPGEYYEKELKQFETLTNITKGTRQKKPQRPPFVKNLLIGEFDREILTYPQLEKDEVQNVENETRNLENLLKQRHMVDVDTLSNKKFRQNLADLKAIGLQASQFLDARECSPMENMKFVETLASHKLRESLLHHEQLAIPVLARFASDELKKKYLHPLIKGEKLAAFCMTEFKLSNLRSLQAKADLSADKKNWILNGAKSWIANGISADYLIVFAVTNITKRDTSQSVQITAFLVEKDFPGVSCKKIDPCDTEAAEIVFQDTPVPVENIIGQLHAGESILSSVISDFRLSCGPSCISLSKTMLEKLLDHMIKESTEDLLMYKTDAVQSRIGEIAMNIYAMESVSYMTAGLQEWYENQDCTIESAIVKVFSSECTYAASSICLDMVGLPATLKSHWANQTHQTCLNYLTMHETNESQKMFIALTGLQFAGVKMADKIKKIRNPLYHSVFTFARMWTERRDIDDNPVLNLELGGYLHPSLLLASKELEYCVKRLEFATQKLLVRYGLEVVNRHVDLRRLAECMIDVYTMTACLARASRSYSIGLQHSDFELILATAFCNAARERVQVKVRQMYVSEFMSNDTHFKAISKQVAKFKGYFVKHPLTRNF